jgi:glutathione S-transferase
MADNPKLYVCHGDDGGPKLHPCRRVQEALREASIEYDKEIAAHGSPIPFLRKGSREELERATGSKKLPVLKLPDGTVLAHSREILRWIAEQPRGGARREPVAAAPPSAPQADEAPTSAPAASAEDATPPSA